MRTKNKHKIQILTNYGSQDHEDQDKGSCDHDEQVKIVAGPVCVQRGSVVNFFRCVSIPEKQEEYKIEKWKWIQNWKIEKWKWLWQNCVVSIPEKQDENKIEKWKWI